MRKYLAIFLALISILITVSTALADNSISLGSIKPGQLEYFSNNQTGKWQFGLTPSIFGSRYWVEVRYANQQLNAVVYDQIRPGGLNAGPYENPTTVEKIACNANEYCMYSVSVPDSKAKLAFFVLEGDGNFSLVAIRTDQVGQGEKFIPIDATATPEFITRAFGKNICTDCTTGYVYSQFTYSYAPQWTMRLYGDQLGGKWTVVDQPYYSEQWLGNSVISFDNGVPRFWTEGYTGNTLYDTNLVNCNKGYCLYQATYKAKPAYPGGPQRIFTNPFVISVSGKRGQLVTWRTDIIARSEHYLNFMDTTWNADFYLEYFGYKALPTDDVQFISNESIELD